MELNIMEEFPLLSSWKDNQYWTGFLLSQPVLVRIALQVPNFPSSKGIKVEGDEDSVRIFKPFQDNVNQLTKSHAPVIHILRELKRMVEDHACNEDLLSAKSFLEATNSELFLSVLNELETIGLENIASVSPNFDDILLNYVDKKGRNHSLKLKIPPQYPQQELKISVTLPELVEPILWTKKIAEVFSDFKKQVDSLSLFWDAMDDLDLNAKVIDPVQPMRSDTYRRILLTYNIVVHLHFNPLKPLAFPEVRFSGPEKDVQELENLLDKECKIWNESQNILSNLEAILSRKFLSNETDDCEQQEETACVVCCCFEFDGKIPETNCECGSVYHAACLSDLLLNDLCEKSSSTCVACPACGLELKVTIATKVASWEDIF